MWHTYTLPGTELALCTLQCSQDTRRAGGMLSTAHIVMFRNRLSPRRARGSLRRRRNSLVMRRVWWRHRL